MALFKAHFLRFLSRQILSLNEIQQSKQLILTIIIYSSMTKFEGRFSEFYWETMELNSVECKWKKDTCRKQWKIVVHYCELIEIKFVNHWILFQSCDYKSIGFDSHLWDNEGVLLRSSIPKLNDHPVVSNVWWLFNLDCSVI